MKRILWVAALAASACFFNGPEKVAGGGSETEYLTLTGSVVLTKDANVMRGNALEVSMATGLAKLSATAENAPPGQPKGRVQGLFAPAQKAPQTPPTPQNP